LTLSSYKIAGSKVAVVDCFLPSENNRLQHFIN